jgi:hypothetical protein
MNTQLGQHSGMTADRAGRIRGLMKRLGLPLTCLCSAALSACGSGGGKPVVAPFGRPRGWQASNSVLVVGSTKDNPHPGGLLISFHPDARFAVGLEVPNLSGRTVIVTGVHVVEPPQSFLHQTGTALLHWSTATCSSPGCATVQGFTFQPVTSTTVRPLEVKSGAKSPLGLQLDYRTGSCAVLSSAKEQSPSHMVVHYHVPNGPPQHQLIPLGRYKPILRRKPVPPICKKQR